MAEPAGARPLLRDPKPGSGSRRGSGAESGTDITERCSSEAHVRAEPRGYRRLPGFWYSGKAAAGAEKIIHGSKKKGISSTKCHDFLCSTARLKQDASCST